MKPLHLLLIGPPGVGKGTQSELLESRLGIVPISSGVIFRAEIDAETDLGRLAKRYIDHGRLVPNGVTIEMMAKRLRSERVRQHGFVLDGFPRNTDQAVALEEMLNENELYLDRAIALVADDEVVVKRLSGRMGCTKCGSIYHTHSRPPTREWICDHCNSPLFIRSDDQPEAIRERLRIYHETTSPIIDYYSGQGILLRVDATHAPDVIYQEILAGLDR
ncbi:MAG: adenylate kinase [Armatimonadetes bacterium]|nr:adenylate kinase [Armatimonadota bacterium]